MVNEEFETSVKGLRAMGDGASITLLHNQLLYLCYYIFFLLNMQREITYFFVKQIIMISASHNPYYDNGIKVINGKGHKMEAEVEEKIEAYIDGDAGELPLAKKIVSPLRRPCSFRYFPHT